MQLTFFILILVLLYLMYTNKLYYILQIILSPIKNFSGGGNQGGGSGGGTRNFG